MQEVAKFEKVSFDQWKKDCESLGFIGAQEQLFEMWENIKLPTRATFGSAGYDFYAPFGFVGGIKDTIPTGIRCKIEPGWFLMCCPKSGLGFKYGMRLRNTVGIVDADYYNSDNEGHIMAKFRCDEESFVVNSGDKFMQGIFVPFGITENDNANGVRNGGFGSTGA